MSVKVSFNIYGKTKSIVSDDTLKESAAIMNISSIIDKFLESGSIAEIELEIENGKIISQNITNLSSDDVQQLTYLLSPYLPKG